MPQAVWMWGRWKVGECFQWERGGEVILRGRILAVLGGGVYEVLTDRSLIARRF